VWQDTKARRQPSTQGRTSSPQRLRQLGLFETRFLRESLKNCTAMIEETRAWINFEITECMHEREQRGWARFGKVRRRWEEKYADPNDALIKAEKLTGKLARGSRPT
jgi:hypothetical protein